MDETPQCPCDAQKYRRRDRTITAGVALLAAIPSLLWALSAPDLLTDDYMHLESFRRQGIAGALWTWAFESPARPLAAFYHLFNYGLIGDRPVIQALLLGALNAGLAASIWLFARRWLPTAVALGAAVIYAVAPNRGASRLWFATGNYVLAAIVAIVGCHLLFDRRRPAAAAGTLAAAVLLFEGVVGLVAAAVAAWALLDLRSRWRTALLVVAPSAFALAFIYLQSPKRADGADADIASSMSTMVHGLFGSGLWGEGMPAHLGLALFLTLLVLGAAALLPSFERHRLRSRWTTVGLALTIAVTAPMVAAGLTFAVRGIFDRTNTIPLIAVSILLASTLHTFDIRPRAALVAAVPLTLYLLSLNLQDVRDYEQAARSGRAIVERVVADVPEDVDDVVVFPPAPQGTGIAPFIYASDLDLALRLRHEPRGTTLLPWHRAQCEAIAARTPSAIGYDWRRREALRNPATVCFRR